MVAVSSEAGLVALEKLKETNKWGEGMGEGPYLIS